MSKEFKYYPEDFGKLTVKVSHYDLDFDVFDDHTVVKSDLKANALQSLKELVLNAENLDIKSVACDVGNVSFDYKKDDDKLVVKFSKVIPKGKEFTISTETVCRPTKNDLEGLYYDVTPVEGAPPSQITQCQQWGFPRLVPCIDDMTAKCTYITTITADDRYTNIISNGDLVEGPVKAGKGRVKVKYDNTVTPMSTYLFFLGVGTYATFKKEFEYPNGDKFMLELLIPPDSNPKDANHALDILYDSIMWIHLFTGPKKYDNELVCHEVLDLVRERDDLKAVGKDVSKLRQKLKRMTRELVLGYKYTGTVYREIGMQNSNYGGMENVGNTTITTDKIIPFKDLTDGGFEYLIDVKTHEFYHNLNGSEVTGRSPFEIWLNEAVTVHVSNEHLDFLFGEEYVRLGNVINLVAPVGGVFYEDKGATSLPIEPDGFNTPNELITSITY
ncbi:MAG: DUF3458 domain-containing protein, partial [Candidatus Diapherotrites archaeon]|nr:DUF3458 domain-containing protein [Candidatus Diapherotrites archaeon]